MELLPPFLMEFLYLAQLAFTIWMLVDCYRRGAEGYWFFIILFVPFIGAWAYFFAIKLGDFSRNRGLAGVVGSPFQGLWAKMTRPSLDEIRYRTQQSPTFTNHVNLADRLIEQHDYAGAIPHLQAALERESEHGQVLYLLAQCHLEQGQPDQAIPLLQRILNKDRHWSNYAAWHLLLEAKAKANDPAGALTSCRELNKFAPILQHRCLLAEHLLANGLHDEARQLLDQSLADYRFATGNIRWRNRRWASLARKLQKQAVR